MQGPPEGGPHALAFGRVMTSFLYGVEPGDPATLALAVGILAAVAMAACLLPACRATRISPLVALRTD